ncbi:3-hydroxyacyl-CoA dehydrogenase family protein [Streptomyces mirabilis]|uniref:3-hydroxyacyl-CoA dehydrogenase family protein n=1 Tax=Streptomyces mirabilis TaxID=68239 RepID=UPI0033D11EFE
MVNSLLTPCLLFAIWILESGFTADGIDDAMVLGCSHPMGALALHHRSRIDLMIRTTRAA